MNRKVGDWVWLKPNAGFRNDSDRLHAEIQPDGCEPCWLCDNPECVEWATLWTEPDPQNDGKRQMLCHVSECQMLDD
jgi:hypothetical protein